MTAIIDGKAIAADLRVALGQEVREIQASTGETPCLAVVLIGENPASQVYVRNKVKACQETGVRSVEHKLPDTTTETDLLALIDKMNRDRAIHGILVQLPLPASINETKILSAIMPEKDVDGFHPLNVGRMVLGQPCLTPCTPQGSLLLIKSVCPKMAGMEALIIGRSNIVGKPMAHLLLKENCTVTIAHSHTHDLATKCRHADIVVAAIGKPNFVHGDWIKFGSIVIDVGINRIALPDGSTKLVGDVDFAAASERAEAITPVPGGVGPMTIACLIKNTLAALKLQREMA